MRRALSAVLALAMLFAGVARAVQPDEILPDPALESRARALSAELRCLVCQNQSIDDSDAPLARDLRILVRERLKAGESDEAVLDFVVARYGEFVLLRPAMNPRNALLWLTPGLLVFGGAVVLWRLSRRRQAMAETVPLDDDEKRLLEAITRSNGG